MNKEKDMKKTAFIAIVGRPNVGKSTLLNAILGEKIAIVSKKPQTTRNRITGIHTVGENQYVFLDTPGIHKPRTKLGDYMVKTADDTLGDADSVILVVEPREAIGDIERTVIDRIKERRLGAILVINKIDSVQPQNVAKTIAAYSEYHDFDAVVPISAKNGTGLEELKKNLVKTQQNLLGDSDTTLVTNQRHVQALTDSRTSLLRVRDGLAYGLPTDLASQDIREAIYHLGSIVGEISTDEVLGNIFRNFCIGK